MLPTGIVSFDFFSNTVSSCYWGLHFPADGTEEALTPGHTPKVSGDWV